MAVSGRHVWAMGILAASYSEWGKIAEAKAIYAELVARASVGYVQPMYFALAAAAAGDSDKAVDLAQEACEIRDPILIICKYFPGMQRLREAPRFMEILARIGLQ